VGSQGRLHETGNVLFFHLASVFLNQEMDYFEETPCSLSSGCERFRATPCFASSNPVGQDSGDRRVVAFRMNDGGWDAQIKNIESYVDRGA
jgi:hypothetical protein